uniref:Gldg family protein n=1 Tax=Ruminococcus sp. TaxID=41978 RepID=UPI003FD7FA8A
DNYTLKDLSLLNLDTVPEDADIVLINAPTSDFSKEDCDKIRTYIENGGNVYFIMEATIVLENLENLMETYGIRAEDGIVMEQDSSRIYGETPTYMIPVINDTEITRKQYEANLALLVPIAKGLTEKTGTGRTITGLLSTSNYAFSKVNLDSEYLSREDEDITGPFYLAALSEKEGSGSMIVLASSNMCTDQVDEVVSGNNIDFLLNGFNYLVGDADKMSIRSKDIQYDANVYTTMQTRVISAVAEWGLPALILAVGIVLVFVRKRRSRPLSTEV